MPKRKSGPSVKEFGCVHCGDPFDTYPPDDVHNVATRDKDEYEDHIQIDYKCKNCETVNTIYWGRLEMMSLGKFGE